MRVRWRMPFVRIKSFRDINDGDCPLWAHVLRIDALTRNPKGRLAGIFGTAIEFGSVERGNPKLLALLLALHEATRAVLRRQTMAVGSFRSISEPNVSFAECWCPLRPRATPNVIGTIGCTAFEFNGSAIAAPHDCDSTAQIDK